MDIWQNGRQELADELKRVCDRIGTDLAAGLDDENNVFISREKLKALRERAAKADELEDEVSSLVRQKRSWEAKVGETSALTEKVAEIGRLVEDKARLAEELETHRNTSLRVGELEKENQRLAGELKRALDCAKDRKTADGGSLRSTPLPSSGEPPSSASRVDTNGLPVVAKETYESLVKKYNRVCENNGDLSSAREKIAKTLEDARGKYREHYDNQERKIKRKDATIEQQKEELQRLRAELLQDRDARKSDFQLPREIVEEKPLRTPGDLSDDRVVAYDLPLLLPGEEHGNNTEIVETEFEALEPCTSTTSEATPYVSPQTHQAPGNMESSPRNDPQSPDTPIVISSKSVRKTRSRKETTAPATSPRVKIETISSSPIGLAGFIALDESIDLDDIGQKQITPRKGRPFLQQALRTSSSLAHAARSELQTPHCNDESELIDSQASQETPVRRNGVKRTSSILQPRSGNTHILLRTSVDRASKRRRVASDQAVRDLLEDGQAPESAERNPPTYEQAMLLPELLSRPSPPRPDLSVTPAQMSSRRNGGRSALPSRANEVTPEENGDSFSTRLLGIREAIGQRAAQTSRPSSKGSVRSLKDPPRSSPKKILRGSAETLRPVSRSTPGDSAYPARERPKILVDTTHQKQSRQSAEPFAQIEGPSSRHSVRNSVERPSSRGSIGKSTSLRPVDQLARSHSREHNETPSRPQAQPLRSRPIDQLTLQDFKVNPNYNQGYGYAFREVVRKQAERRCLPGCTRPECCGGKFRVLAEATRDPNQTPTASQEETDEKMLQEFLGDNSYKLRNMTRAERHETLIQAMTRDMSNRMGKHKHMYERRQSPPGYWRSDFPSTQEQFQDRAKAEELEREQLARRYEEAMRGGAYIFRDE